MLELNGGRRTAASRDAARRNASKITQKKEHGTKLKRVHKREKDKDSKERRQIKRSRKKEEDKEESKEESQMGYICLPEGSYGAKDKEEETEV